MNDFDYIDKLIKEKISEYKVPTKLKWDDLQSKLTPRYNPGSSMFRLGNLMKFLVGTAAVVGGILFFSKDNKKTYNIKIVKTSQIALDSVRKPVFYKFEEIQNINRKKTLEQQVETNTPQNKAPEIENIPDTTIQITIEKDTIFEE